MRGICRVVPESWSLKHNDVLTELGLAEALPRFIAPFTFATKTKKIV